MLWSHPPDPANQGAQQTFSQRWTHSEQGYEGFQERLESPRALCSAYPETYREGLERARDMRLGLSRQRQGRGSQEGTATGTTQETVYVDPLVKVLEGPGV